MLGRFFKRFEERVEGAFGEHVGFVDDVDFESTEGGAVLGVVDHHFAGFFDLRVAGGVDFDDVHSVAAGDGETGFALAAGFGGGLVEFFAVEGFGEDTGHRGFACAARAAEEIGVSDSAGFDGAFQCLGDVLLPDDFIKSL